MVPRRRAENSTQSDIGMAASSSGRASGMPNRNSQDID
jgi:hypothetical protein